MSPTSIRVVFNFHVLIIVESSKSDYQLFWFLISWFYDVAQRRSRDQLFSCSRIFLSFFSSVLTSSNRSNTLFDLIRTFSMSFDVRFRLLLFRPLALSTSRCFFRHLEGQFVSMKSNLWLVFQCFFHRPVKACLSSILSLLILRCYVPLIECQSFLQRAESFLFFLRSYSSSVHWSVYALSDSLFFLCCRMVSSISRKSVVIWSPMSSLSLSVQQFLVNLSESFSF